MRTALLSLLLFATPAHALNEGLQCVPFARALTGVEIRGDAHSWWDQAEGRYERGSRPKVGAVMTFIPHGNMRLGHVAAVRRIIDKRTLLISHANWSTIGGVRGHIEEDVRVIDVSEENDWSRVRVWYTPNGALGTTEWPLHGFIYPDRPRKEAEARKALAAVLAVTPRPASPTLAATMTPRGSTNPAPNQKAAARNAIAPPTRPMGFALSSGLLAEIDRKAKKEKPRAAS
ncbi:CHAP domain-containing protein [Sphingorhabdus sp.]|jgi:surface antigen|uniref:CHAP domain-containing protein n=1 Tax=Sphingorhabdus sp. TaxID=1902408 RepID=UPI0037CA4632